MREHDEAEVGERRARRGSRVDSGRERRRIVGKYQIGNECEARYQR
jgi:hypothetical protein